MPQIWQPARAWKSRLRGKAIALWVIVISLCLGQTLSLQAQSTEANSQINVNWLYGSFVPKNAPLQPLDARLRWKLYIRQTFTTPGIYVKTTLFSIHDQIHNSVPEWGGGIQGFAYRFGSRQGQFVVQNSVSSLGFALAGWEPRYDRCRCDGFWPRARHAIARNFVTYDQSEKDLRPQIMPYLGAFAGSATSAIWKPVNARPWTEGYQGVIAQVPIGIGINFLSEFAPEITRIIHKKTPD